MKKILFALVVLCSCSQSDHYGLGENDNINTSDQIKFMFKSYATQCKQDGMSAKKDYLSYALESFYIPPGHKTEIGSDSLKRLYAAWDQQNKLIEFELKDIHVFPVNKVSANYHYQIEISYLDSSRIKKQIKQLESGAVIKIENDWRFLNCHTITIE